MDALTALFAGASVVFTAVAIAFGVAIIAMPFMVWGIHSKIASIASDVRVIRDDLTSSLEMLLSTVPGITTPPSPTDADPLLRDAAEAVIQVGEGSTSVIQRRLSVGYVRASRLLDQLETLGILGPRQGPHAREVLIASRDLDRVLPPSL